MIVREWRLFLVALQFLTRIPINSVPGFTEDWLVRCAKYFPLVGAMVGAICGIVALGTTAFFPDPLPVLFTILAGIIVTGALHEDGLADTIDGFGGGTTRESVLEIMRDSRLGTYGAIGLVSVLAIKVAALMSMDPMSIMRVLIAAHAIGRLAGVVTLNVLSFAGDPATAKVSQTTSQMTPMEISVAVVFGLGAGLLVVQPVTFIFGALAATIGTVGLILLAKRKIGGFTGDVLGAAEQVAETAFIVAAVAIVNGPG